MRRARSWAAAVVVLGLAGGSCVCLDLAEPRRYRCTADTQCMGGWRCGTDGFCVDPSGDSLQQNSGAPLVAVAKVSPADPEGLPDLVAVGQERSFPSTCAGGSTLRARPVIAQVRGDQVTLAASWSNGRQSLRDGGLPRGTECDPSTTKLVFQDRFTGSLGGRRALDLAVVRGVPHVLVEGGGLCSFQWAPGSAAMTASCRTGVFSSSATRLRSSPEGQDLLLAHSTSGYTLYDVNDGGVRTGQLATSGGTPQSIRDMLVQGRAGAELLTAINDNGFFVTSLAGYHLGRDGGTVAPFGQWEAVQTDDVECDAGFPDPRYGPPLGIRAAYDARNTVNGSPLLLVHVQEDQGGVPADVALLYAETGDAGVPWSGRCAPLPAPRWSPPRPGWYVEKIKQCYPCDLGHWLRDYRAGWDYPPGLGAPTLVMEARCVPRDGGSGEEVAVIHDVMAECPPKQPIRLPDIARYTRPTRWDRSDGYGSAFATDLGHLYATDNVGGLALPAAVMERLPANLVQTANGLVASTSSQNVGNSSGTVRVGLLPGETFHEGPGFAGVGNDDLPFFASVAGRPTWGLTGQEAVGLYFVVENIDRPLGPDQPPLRVLAHFSEAVAPSPPFVGAALRNAAGRQILMLSFDDALTAGDITAFADDPTAGNFSEPQAFFSSPELDVRVVPLPQTPITAIVPLPPDPGASPPLFAEAYVAQGGRVFHVTAANHTLWHADEIDLGGAEVIAVMADGRRGRAGTKDGYVYALPSRVPLSGPLAGAPVSDYAQAGATTFAVAQGGLFRLVSDGTSPLGSWEQIPVSPLPQDGRGFTGARLYSVADQLLLFLHSGWGYKINGGR